MKKVILVSLLFSVQAFAWGPMGHSTVCQIAENHLTAKAKTAVRSLLGRQSFSDSCNWPDQVRKSKEYGYADTWHYVTIPNGKSYESSSKNPLGDVIAAIKKLTQVLVSGKSDREKSDALKFLGHFVGDIHQPLHVGRDNDRGGNQCLVNPKSNLHAVWDSKILEVDGGKSWDLAQRLDRLSQKEIDLLQASTVDDWANESMVLRERIVYPANKSGGNDPSPFCAKVGTQPFNGPIDLEQSYYSKHSETAQSRVLQAGVRLAGLLNGVFR